MNESVGGSSVATKTKWKWKRVHKHVLVHNVGREIAIYPSALHALAVRKLCAEVYGEIFGEEKQCQHVRLRRRSRTPACCSQRRSVHHLETRRRGGENPDKTNGVEKKNQFTEQTKTRGNFQFRPQRHTRHCLPMFFGVWAENGMNQITTIRTIISQIQQSSG